MNEIKDIRHDLINEIMHIEDIDTLNSLYDRIEQSKKSEGSEMSQEIDKAIITVKKGVTLDEIVAEQNVDQITYDEIRSIVDEISWEVSLEELLASID